MRAARLFRALAERAARGIPGSLASRLLPGEPAVAVLLYHRILPVRGPDPWSLVVSETNFREQIAMLASRYPILPLDRALRDLEAKSLPARRVLSITFDDGYRDNRTRALPILAEHAVPATIFLSTGHARSGEPFWWDRIEQARAERTVSAGSPSYLEIKAMEPHRRERALTEIAGPAPRFDADDLPMGFDEVRSLPEWISVGGHGDGHLSLGLAPREAVARDVAACAACLRKEVPRHVPLFAYPYGGPEDLGPAGDEALRREGFTAAFTTRPGVVRRGADRWRLPRLRVDDVSAGVLAGRLLRAFLR